MVAVRHDTSDRAEDERSAYRVGDSPATIGRYRILGELGRGGMSVVYHGLDTTLDRHVAIKVLHAHLASDPASRERFGREARAVARLRHPAIIEIHDFSEGEEGPSYLVCEFVAGQTLRAFMEQHRVHFAEVAALIALPICRAVAHAHELNIVHRDLKPENVMVTSDGHIKLMDFGIAKLIDQQQQMTLTGSLLGSPAHMAPEQLEGGAVDFRTDVFAIGTLLYWLATGTLPFSGETPHQVIKNIVEVRYPDPLRLAPETGEQLAGIIRRALNRDPQLRFPTAGQMAEALEQFLRQSGLEDHQDWLVRLLTEPAVTVAELRARVAEALLQRGRQLYRQRQYARALRLFDRLLALQPDNREVLELVDGHRRRQRRRRLLLRIGLAGLVLLVLSGGTLLLARLWPEEGPAGADGGTADAGALLAGSGTAPAPVVDAGGNAADGDAGGGTDAGPARPLRRAGHPPADRGTRPERPARRAPGDRRRPPRVAMLQQHPVEIVAEPFFEQILVDGKLVATSRDESTRFGHLWRGRLPAGSHRVVIRHPACAEDAFQLRVPVEGQIRRKLHFLPARLVVRTPDARVGVYLADSYRGTAGQSTKNPIAVTMEGRRASRTVQVRLVDGRGRQVTRQVQLRAGRRTVLEVKADEFARAGRSPP